MAKENNYKHQKYLIKSLALRELKDIKEVVEKLETGEYTPSEASASFNDYYRRLGSIPNMIRKLPSEKKGAEEGNKTVDNIVSAIMLISGIFLFAYFISMPQQVATQNVQLAPPMPSIWVAAISLLLIAGVIYFMVTRVFLKKVSIPLSFQ